MGARVRAYRDARATLPGCTLLLLFLYAQAMADKTTATMAEPFAGLPGPPLDPAVLPVPSVPLFIYLVQDPDARRKQSVVGPWRLRAPTSRITPANR